jgi:hypothetical protein
MLLDNDQKKFTDIAFHVKVIFRYKKKKKCIFLSFCREFDPLGVR